jgi:hypothetical protein
VKSLTHPTASGNNIATFQSTFFAEREGQDDVSSDMFLVNDFGFPSNKQDENSPKREQSPQRISIPFDCLELQAAIFREYTEGEKSPLFQKVILETPETDPVKVTKPIEPTIPTEAQAAIEGKDRIESKPIAHCTIQGEMSSKVAGQTRINNGT